MSSRRDGGSEQPLATRKAQDRALLLPLIGLALLIPPVGGLFQLELRVAGIPFTLLYLFVVWGLLIAGAALLSKQLGDVERPAGGARLSQGSRGKPI